ncbi:MAG: 3'(2'),5'-bisphosphate nucleotidase CysQ [Pseudohongiellaceae bacterium]
MEYSAQLQTMHEIACAAGQQIMQVYESDAPVEVATKDDASPLTEADRRAHQLITDALSGLPEGLPILSEESEAISYDERSGWQTYWLVDPLDGTKEFISRNGEFTVNIALIDNGIARAGVVHVPVSGFSYVGELGYGAWKIQPDGAAERIFPTTLTPDHQCLRVVASRSHLGEREQQIVARLRERFEDIEMVSMGSSLKFCLLAEGGADFYPRLAPTSEWDTAAAHAVLRAAGGDVVTSDFLPLRYNQKAELLNPHFMAMADASFDWREILQQP